MAWCPIGLCVQVHTCTINTIDLFESVESVGCRLVCTSGGNMCQVQPRCETLWNCREIVSFFNFQEILFDFRRNQKLIFIIGPATKLWKSKTNKNVAFYRYVTSNCGYSELFTILRSGSKAIFHCYFVPIASRHVSFKFNLLAMMMMMMPRNLALVLSLSTLGVAG